MRIGVLCKQNMSGFFLRVLAECGAAAEFVSLQDHRELRREVSQYVAILSLQYERIIDRETLVALQQTQVPLINLHYSPLPKYRGMYPVTHALLRDETIFGITYHLIDAGIDTGPILMQCCFAIEAGATAEEVYARCCETFEGTIAEVLQMIADESVYQRVVPQDNRRASYFNKHSIDFCKARILTCRDTTADLWRKFRAFYFPRFQRPLLSWRGCYLEVDCLVPVFDHGTRQAGHLDGIGRDGVRVNTLDGSIEIAAVMEGGRRVGDSREVLALLERGHGD